VLQRADAAVVRVGAMSPSSVADMVQDVVRANADESLLNLGGEGARKSVPGQGAGRGFGRGGPAQCERRACGGQRPRAPRPAPRPSSASATPIGAPSRAAATPATTVGWPRAASRAETSTAHRLRRADPRAPPPRPPPSTTPAGVPASRPTNQPRTDPAAPRPPAPPRQHRWRGDLVAAAYPRPAVAAAPLQPRRPGTGQPGWGQFT
jgi:hypothetical protein